MVWFFEVCDYCLMRILFRRHVEVRESLGACGSFLFSHGRPNIRFHRSVTRPFFHKERITDFDIFDRRARDALEQAATRIADGYPIDFQV
jgi:hypothetical protein